MYTLDGAFVLNPLPRLREADSFVEALGPKRKGNFCGVSVH